MAIKSPTPEVLGILRDDMLKGVGANTLLRVLGPILDAKLDYLLVGLSQAEPKLEVLLDYRAKIEVVRQLRYDLRALANAGREAAEVLDSAYVKQPGPPKA